MAWEEGREQKEAMPRPGGGSTTVRTEKSSRGKGKTEAWLLGVSCEPWVSAYVLLSNTLHLDY